MSERVPTSDLLIMKDVLQVSWQGSHIDDYEVWVDARVLDCQDERFSGSFFINVSRCACDLNRVFVAFISTESQIC
jgi:hypothetical protein